MTSLTKTISIFFIVLLFILLIETKVLATYYILPPEKAGYCKLKYGSEWKLSNSQDSCYFYNGLERQENLIDEFELKELCPKNDLFSLKFYSDCFKIGGYVG